MITLKWVQHPQCLFYVGVSDAKPSDHFCALVCVFSSVSFFFLLGIKPNPNANPKLRPYFCLELRTCFAPSVSLCHTPKRKLFHAQGKRVLDELCHSKLGMKLRKEKQRYHAFQRPMIKTSRSYSLPNCRHLLSFHNEKLFCCFRLQCYSVFLSQSRHTFGTDPTT